MVICPAIVFAGENPAISGGVWIRRVLTRDHIPEGEARSYAPGALQRKANLEIRNDKAAAVKRSAEAMPEPGELPDWPCWSGARIALSMDPHRPPGISECPLLISMVGSASALPPRKWSYLHLRQFRQSRHCTGQRLWVQHNEHRADPGVTALISPIAVHSQSCAGTANPDYRHRAGRLADHGRTNQSH